MSDKHLSTQFDAELSGISTRVMEMGGLVESQIRQAVYALSQFNVEVADHTSSRKKSPHRNRHPSARQPR